MFWGSGWREPQMVRVPRGRFLMGSPEGEPGRSDDEGPQHDVRIDYDLEVAKYPVTFREWDAAAKAGACDGYMPSDAGFGRGKRPVILVSWNDAKRYIDWLNQKTGKAYRLLSESEWEYCCRAGTQTAYSFGATLVKWKQANYANRKTEPVDSFPANQFGLVGMHGNVWEWCEDCWNRDYAQIGRPDDGKPWLTGDCSLRVLRGGSWFNDAQDLRSALRIRSAATDRDSNVGFRLARTL